VSNPTKLHRPGAAYLFDHTGELLYEYRHRGDLIYSETMAMARPLTFLTPYIGHKLVMNPLKLPDNEGLLASKRGRGILKLIGMRLKPVFILENRLQLKLLGATEEDVEGSRKIIESIILSVHVVIFTYPLSPSSSEAVSLLEDAG